MFVTCRHNKISTLNCCTLFPSRMWLFCGKGKASLVSQENNSQKQMNDLYEPRTINKQSLWSKPLSVHLSQTVVTAHPRKHKIPYAITGFLHKS